MSQRMAPGHHLMKLVLGWRSLILRRYCESWRCVGCSLTVEFKAGDSAELNQAVLNWITQHNGFLSTQAVLRSIAETALTCRESGVKFSINLSEWQRTANKGVTWR